MPMLVTLYTCYSTSIDARRPLSNDVWVFLFQKIDAERVELAHRAGTSVISL